MFHAPPPLSLSHSLALTLPHPHVHVASCHIVSLLKHYRRALEREEMHLAPRPRPHPCHRATARSRQAFVFDSQSKSQRYIIIICRHQSCRVLIRAYTLRQSCWLVALAQTVGQRSENLLRQRDVIRCDRFWRVLIKFTFTFYSQVCSAYSNYQGPTGSFSVSILIHRYFPLAGST